MGSTNSVTYLNGYLTTISISLMMVALGITITGIGFARLRTGDSRKAHRWMMSSAIVLTVIATSFIMVPSLYIYYHQGYSVTSGFSILQIFHSAESVPALMLGIMFAFNKLPKPIRRWMWITACLWIVAIGTGAAVYYTMPF